MQANMPISSGGISMPINNKPICNCNFSILTQDRISMHFTIFNNNNNNNNNNISTATSRLFTSH